MTRPLPASIKAQIRSVPYFGASPTGFAFVPRRRELLACQAEMARLDAIGRTRALTELESRRLERLIERERRLGYAADQRRRAGKAS